MILKITAQGLKVQTCDGRRYDLSAEMLQKAFVCATKTLCLGEEVDVHDISDPCRKTVAVHLWAPDVENLLMVYRFPPVARMHEIPKGLCVVARKVNGMWKKCTGYLDDGAFL